MLVASFPQQLSPSDEENYLEQMMLCCIGLPKSAVKSIVHPVDGLLARSKFLPSVSEVAEYLKPWRRSQRAPAPERPLLPAAKDKPEDTKEVKDAAIARWEAQKRRMRENFFGEAQKPSTLVWKQYHDPEALLEALNRHEETL